MNEEHEMTKEEAIVALARLANATADAETLRALLLGCKALARAGIHKRRNKAARAAEKEAPAMRSALAASARNCDCAKDEAEDRFKKRFGRPWTQAEDELAAWIFATAKGKEDKQ